MGMPCEVNSILKLTSTEFPGDLAIGEVHQATKSGYRILPIDAPIQLVDEQWLACCEVVIVQLTWANQQTVLAFRIHRIYDQPFAVK